MEEKKEKGEPGWLLSLLAFCGALMAGDVLLDKLSDDKKDKESVL